jgi:hypothetical protein
MRRRADHFRDRLHFQQGTIAAVGNVPNDAARAGGFQAQQRTSQRRLTRPVVTFRRSHGHERRASVRHNRPQNGEIEIDQARRRDEFGQAAWRMISAAILNAELRVSPGCDGCSG